MTNKNCYLITYFLPWLIGIDQISHLRIRFIFFRFQILIFSRCTQSTSHLKSLRFIFFAKQKNIYFLCCRYIIRHSDSLDKFIIHAFNAVYFLAWTATATTTPPPWLHNKSWRKKRNANSKNKGTAIPLYGRNYMRNKTDRLVIFHFLLKNKRIFFSWHISKRIQVIFWSVTFLSNSEAFRAPKWIFLRNNNSSEPRHVIR